MSAAADRLAGICFVTRLQPSEARALTMTEIAAFVELANRRAEAMRSKAR